MSSKVNYNVFFLPTQLLQSSQFKINTKVGIKIDKKQQKGKEEREGRAVIDSWGF